MLKKTLIGIFTLGSLGSAWAGGSEIERAIEYRSGLMEVYSWNMYQMGKQLKNPKTYDAARFARFAKELHQATQLDLLSGFPEDSDDNDDTDAKSEIWLDWDTFSNKLKTLQKETAKLAEVAKNQDLNAIKTQFGAVGKSCKSCHKAFRK